VDTTKDSKFSHKQLVLVATPVSTGVYFLVLLPQVLYSIDCCYRYSQIFNFQFTFGCMTLHDFRQTLSLPTPPELGSDYLLALWHDAKGNWHKAHEYIQDLPDQKASWVHAYLHRKEGDQWNADYWYNRAGRKRPSTSLEQEWETLVEAFL
jgi:hypothetical protein